MFYFYHIPVYYYMYSNFWKIDKCIFLGVGTKLPVHYFISTSKLNLLYDIMFRKCKGCTHIYFYKSKVERYKWVVCGFPELCLHHSIHSFAILPAFVIFCEVFFQCGKKDFWSMNQMKAECLSVWVMLRTPLVGSSRVSSYYSWHLKILKPLNDASWQGASIVKWLKWGKI